MNELKQVTNTETIDLSKKILVVHKESIYSLYAHSNDKDLTKKLQNTNDPAVQSMQESDVRQQQSLDSILDTLEENKIIYEVTSRKNAPHNAHDMKQYGLIIAVGGDGTLLDMSHYITDIPILGVNSDPKTSVGYLCGTDAAHFSTLLTKIQSSANEITELHRMKVTVNKITLPEYALNDILFAHQNPAETTRYELGINNENTSYKGSGLLVSTATGSTAWIYQEGGTPMNITSEEIQYFHRGMRSEKGFYFGKLPLQITSRCREGMVYIDGGHNAYAATFGDVVTLEKAPPLRVIGVIGKKE